MLLLFFEQDMTICEWDDEASIASWFINCTRAWHRRKYRLISVNQQTDNILQFHSPELKHRCWSLSPSKPYYVSANFIKDTNRRDHVYFSNNGEDKTATASLLCKQKDFVYNAIVLSSLCWTQLAFDTVDNQILLDRLRYWTSVLGSALHYLHIFLIVLFACLLQIIGLP